MKVFALSGIASQNATQIDPFECKKCQRLINKRITGTQQQLPEIHDRFFLKKIQQ